MNHKLTTEDDLQWKIVVYKNFNPKMEVYEDQIRVRNEAMGTLNLVF
jgi:hypothetical protein